MLNATTRSSSIATICAAPWCGSRTRSSRRTPGPSSVALVGIHTRGAVLGERLHALVGELTGSEVPLGDLDISFYRDDVNAREPGAQPVVHASHLDFDLDGRTVVLVDDVLFTGPHGARGDRRAVRLRPPRAGAARGARRPRPPRAADPPRLRGQEPADLARASGSTCGSRSSTSVDEVTIADTAVEATRDEAPARDRATSSAPTSSGSWSGPRASPRWGAATSRRCRRCAAARSSTSSTSRAPAPAPRSSSPPSGSRPTSSRSRRPAPRSTRASR